MCLLCVILATSSQSVEANGAWDAIEERLSSAPGDVWEAFARVSHTTPFVWERDDVYIWAARIEKTLTPDELAALHIEQAASEQTVILLRVLNESSTDLSLSFIQPDRVLLVGSDGKTSHPTKSIDAALTCLSIANLCSPFRELVPGTYQYMVLVFGSKVSDPSRLIIRDYIVLDLSTELYFGIPVSHSIAPSTWDNYTSIRSCRWRVKEEDYERSSVRFAHIALDFYLENLSSKGIAGAEVQIRCLDSFGDSIFSTIVKIDQPVDPGRIAEPSMYVYWKEWSDTYETLVVPVKAQTMSVVARVIRLSFRDGSVLIFPNSAWKPISVSYQQDDH